MRGATAKDLAMFLHYTYERLAPAFGYETREASRTWDEDSANAKLMIRVCEELMQKWRVDLPPIPPEQFEFRGGNSMLGRFNAAGTFEVCESIEDLEVLAVRSWEVQTRALARLVLVISHDRLALAAADRLAHGYVFSPEHAQYWKAREISGKCSVCNGDGHSSDPET